MPTAANFSIKDGLPTPVDTLFTNLQPASGNLPAVYQARTKGVSPASQPKIAISSKGTQKTREVHVTVRVPYAVVSPEGVTKIIDSAFADLRVVLPDSCPDSIRADLAAYLANSLDVPAVVDTVKNGYAPA